MKLIIDVEKDTYEEICESCKFFTEFEHTPNLYQTIANGKPYKERPHGEWIHISDSANRQRVIYKCSECGRVIDVYYRENLAFSYPFCHCGAQMQKGGAE